MNHAQCAHVDQRTIKRVSTKERTNNKHINCHQRAYVNFCYRFADFAVFKNK